MKHFGDKKVIVVGGTSGIGNLVAQLVLQRGGSALIVGRRDDRVAATVQELRPFGLVTGQRADITRASELEALRSRIDAEHADADHLVNAAGVFVPKGFLDHTIEDYERYLSINRALFFVTQTAARKSVARKVGGSIVNIGPMWAKQAIAATPSSAYSHGQGGLYSEAVGFTNYRICKSKERGM